MGFHPHMYASVRGFDLVDPLCNLVFDQMTVDLWRVVAQEGARGRYVSMHPRIVLLLQGATLCLRQKDGPERRAAACFIPAGVELWGRVEAPGEMAHVDIHLDRRTLRGLSDRAVALPEPILLPDLGPLAPLADLLARECRDPHRDPGHVERLAQLILLELLHHAAPRAPDPAPERQSWVAGVEAHVLNHLREKLSVDRLAQVAGMSRTSFNRRFREVLGKAPYQWVLEMRCAQAQRLMTKGLSLAEVADLCGFSDQAHFNRVFKSVTGQTPNLWMIGPEAGARGSNIQDSIS